MIAQANKVVGIVYTLTENGSDEVIEKVNPNQPFYFLMGAGNLLETFEANLAGLTAGDTFDFVLTATEAYGEFDENAIVDIPVDVFIVNGRFAEELVQEGKPIHMQDQNGYPLTGTVVKRGLEHVKIDFNHPMAGKSLHFTGNVLEVRDASPEEISHGHVHGAHGHDH